MACGLYVRRELPVRWSGVTPPAPTPTLALRTTAALVYIASRRGEGIAQPGYIELVVDAARDWKLPEAYIRTLTRWSPSGWQAARRRDTGEVG